MSVPMSEYEHNIYLSTDMTTGIYNDWHVAFQIGEDREL